LFFFFFFFLLLYCRCNVLGWLANFHGWHGFVFVLVISLSLTSWCTIFNLANENASLFMGFVILVSGYFKADIVFEEEASET